MVLATTDGGQTWETRSSERARQTPWTSIQFDPHGRVGWAQRASCDPYHPPCQQQGGAWRTTDGGATWRGQQPAMLGFDALDATHAWATDLCAQVVGCGIVWRTVNGGRSWSRSVGPRGLGFRSVAVAGTHVVVTTDAGYLESRDAGKSWHRLAVRFPRGSSSALASIKPGVAFVPGRDGRSAWLSADGGRSWRRLRLPVSHPETASFVDFRSGIVVSGRVAYTTADGGRTWARRTLPFGGDDVELGVAPGLLTETHGFNPRELAISADGGASWRVVRFPRGYRDVGALAGRGRTLSVTAGRVGSGGEQYLSFDGGATWLRVRGDLPERVTFDGAELWGVDEFGRSGLWHSSDGGRHWTEVWPRLPVSR